MSLVTRCPSCTTIYKVVNDQLRISDGWVRCGRCGYVFDASVLTDEAGEPSKPSHDGSGVFTGGMRSYFRRQSAPAAPRPADELLELLESSQLPTKSTIASPPTPTPSDAVLQLLQPSAADEPADEPYTDVTTLLGSEGLKEEPEETEFTPPPLNIPVLPGTGEGAEPSFIGAVPKPAWRAAIGSRLALSLGCGLAFVFLLLQILMHERDTIAAYAPALRPTLQALCGMGRCKLDAPRNIGAITIEGSSFSRGRGQGYQLMFTLRNAAAITLAMPAVELTLVDTRERAIVRRVLTPAEFGAPAVLSPKSEQSSTLAVELGGAQESSLPPVAGYHLLAFYP